MPLGLFGPRVGFAWQPLSSNRLVVRAGYGMVYQRVNGNFLFGPNNTLPLQIMLDDGSEHNITDVLRRIGEYFRKAHFS